MSELKDSDSELQGKGQSARRCAYCKKRVKMSGFSCKCGRLYCTAHRLPEDHACQHDHRREGRELIAQANVKVMGSKLAAL